MRILWILMGTVFLGGCLVRTYTIEKPRVDTEIKGNQGYLAGTTGKEKGKKKLGDTRKISVIEIELGSHQPERIEKKKAEEQAYLAEQGSLEEEIGRVEEVEVSSLEESTAKEKSYKYYTIQKNDTLQKISYKFYGTTKKWKLLYEENKDVIESPDKVYQGMKIRIPLGVK